MSTSCDQVRPYQTIEHTTTVLSHAPVREASLVVELHVFIPCTFIHQKKYAQGPPWKPVSNPEPTDLTESIWIICGVLCILLYFRWEWLTIIYKMMTKMIQWRIFEEQYALGQYGRRPKEKGVSMTLWSVGLKRKLLVPDGFRRYWEVLHDLGLHVAKFCSLWYD